MAGSIPTLRRTTDFRRLYGEGRAFHCEDFVLIVRHTGERPAKVAFVASRKVGNAVKRNRARRVLREALRSLSLNLDQLDVHLALIARRSCAGVATEHIRDQLAGALKAAGLAGTAPVADGDTAPRLG